MCDVHVLYSESKRQWHVVQVLELWINPLATTTTTTTRTDIQKDQQHENDSATEQQKVVVLPVVVGAHGGHNAVLPRRTLKGIGVTPTGFVLPLLDNNNNGNPQQPDDETTTTMYNDNKKKTIMSYSIQTAGCQMNVADSERIEGILQHELHMTRAENVDEADLILLNTCSIRDRAEQQVYNALGPFAARKRNGQHSLGIVVTGCVAQQEGEALLRKVPEVDVVIGPQYVPFLKNVLEQVAWGHQVVATAPMLLQEESYHHHQQQQHQQQPHDEKDNKNNSTGSSNTSLSRMVSNDNDRAGLFTKPVRGHDVRAWVNVITGCNEHCTYCVVPATRGMEQSRSMEAILQECLQLAQSNYKEVTLLGQNIDAYGRDMVPKRTFADLLGFLNDRIPTKMRIRYVTSHPRYFSNRVIDAVANLDKVCECFHMPFQAGDDNVLRAMRRGYDVASYMRIIDKIREKAPDSAICADVIVGFPGETDAAFERTLELMEKVKFDNLNSFAYSPRPNTEAALWEHDEKKNLLVPENVKAERLQRVQQLATQHGLERSMRYVGRTVEVLVEDANPRNAQQQVMGRTRQGRQVYFDGCLDELRGEFVQVHITKARPWSLMGELVSR
jgi:tRNA-2-methylthio-N6-dimethylallyladenosine synthase